MRFFTHAAEAYPSSSRESQIHHVTHHAYCCIHSFHHLQISQGEMCAVCFWKLGSWSFMPPADRSEITNIGALNFPRSTRSTPSVDEPERSNEGQPVVRRYSRTRAQSMELMECYLKACPTTGGFLRGWAVKRMTEDQNGSLWPYVTFE